MLAASAMNGALFDATYNIFFKMKYAKLYDAMLVDAAAAERRGAAARSPGRCCAARSTRPCSSWSWSLWVWSSSWWMLLALPAHLLIGYAFAGAGMALTTWMRSWQDFEYVQLAILPMFLFSGDVLPALDLPGAVQGMVEWTPLYQGVLLMRDLTTGAVGPADLAHVGYLAVIGGAGLLVASRRLGQLLLK